MTDNEVQPIPDEVDIQTQRLRERGEIEAARTIENLRAMVTQYQTDAHRARQAPVRQDDEAAARRIAIALDKDEGGHYGSDFWMREARIAIAALRSAPGERQ